MRVRRAFLGERDIYVPEQVIIADPAPASSSWGGWALAALAALAFWKG